MNQKRAHSIRNAHKTRRESVRVLEEMLQQDVVPNSITYSTLIRACEKGKQPEQALKVFDTMQ